VLAKDDYNTPICDVRVGETLGLLSALDWVHNLNLGPVDFELDSKLVVDSFNSNKVDVTEFGEIIPHRIRLFSSNLATNTPSTSCLPLIKADWVSGIKSPITFASRATNTLATNL
jgi:ribonuclease HI